MIEMVATLINGRDIAQEIRRNVAENVKQLKTKNNVMPVVTTIVVGDNPSSALYLKLRDAACNEVGITP
jgi:methylenetetrahydrofolate dehydrogenase (NADP+)/methenyltetrahydrofolate cyclohydrolase